MRAKTHIPPRRLYGLRGKSDKKTERAKCETVQARMSTRKAREELKTRKKRLKMQKISISIRVPRRGTATVLASPERVTHYEPGG